jgi:hypothetical protein
MKWKFLGNVWIYHLIVDLPTLLFFIYWFESGHSAVDFTVFAIIYPFLYRPYMDFYRLRAMGILEDGEMHKVWKWGTLFRFKYYSKLMFGK